MSTSLLPRRPSAALALVRPALVSTALTAPLLFGSCEALSALSGESRPDARVTAASIGDLTLEALTLNLDVEVENPYSVALPIGRLDYSLASGDAPFLSGETTFQGTVPAGGKRLLEVPARVSFRDALELLSGIRPGEVLPYDVDLGIAVDAPVLGALRLPVRHKGELPIPAVPDVKVANIAWKELGLTGAKAQVDLEIGNTNAFPLDLSNLDFGLSLGGHEVADLRLANALALKPGDKGQVSIPIQISPLKLGMAVFDILRGSEASYGLQGSLGAQTPYGPLAFPLDASGQTSFTR